MEQLNKVELIGIVGSVYVKDFGNMSCVNFSVATNEETGKHLKINILQNQAVASPWSTYLSKGKKHRPRAGPQTMPP